MKKIVTTHMFGLIYDAAPVWLSELTSSKSWKILESIHFKALGYSSMITETAGQEQRLLQS